MPVRRILGGGGTWGVSFWPFPSSSGWWWLINSTFLTRTACHKMTHANGYCGAWAGWAASVSVLLLTQGPHFENLCLRALITRLRVMVVRTKADASQAPEFRHQPCSQLASWSLYVTFFFFSLYISKSCLEDWIWKCRYYGYVPWWTVITEAVWLSPLTFLLYTSDPEYICWIK